MTTWFRFYNEALDDPKVQKLEPFYFKAWVNLLCLASRNNGKIPSIENTAFALRLASKDTETVIERLLIAGLIERFNGGLNGYHYEIHSWRKRQYISDTSTERVKRFRERSKKVTETRPDTDTDTDTERKVKVEAPRASRGRRLPPDWQPKEHLDRPEELEKFRDYWIAQPGMKGTKVDWDATWRNWIRNARPLPKPVDKVMSLAEEYAQRARESEQAEKIHYLRGI